MNDRERSILKSLLTDRRVLALSVLVEGAPYLGQLPFAVRPDFGAALILASGIARHSRGLVDDAPFAALVHAPEDAADDPFQLPRVTLEGTVRTLGRDHDDFDAARADYLAKLPTGEMLFQLGDFTLHELVIAKARFVAGFGSAHTVTPAKLRAL